MRLKKLKLAGFKSFVDPITVEFKSELVGIVGPNGCGKSNIIDAIRWVMGETSAKNLRGGSMADVIFNGSSTRKPVGQAHVELIFDNSEGKLGGEYASYTEISIKREVDRDGQSDYFLNGTKCRRRDITDIFLGTGLGPRSYSIIEQGMISRVIEAKPENLRAFLEEAAGISIYKKRRHDTELRINHTKENLERIEDLIQEQERTLEKLKRQSSSAGKYKEYKSEAEILDVQLSALKWRDFDSNLQIYSEQLRNISTQLEERLARKASIDNDLATLKVEHNERSDNVAEIQAEFYETGTEITKREQSISHLQERKNQLLDDLALTEKSAANLKQQIEEDNASLEDLTSELDSIEPNFNLLNEESTIINEELAQKKYELEQWNSKWDDFQELSQESHQKAEVEKTKIEQIEKQIRDIQVNIERLQHEQSTLHDDEFEELITSLTAEIEDKEIANKAKSEEYELLQDNIASHRTKQKQYRDEIDSVRTTIQTLKGRKSSLEALQQAAINSDGQDAANWLSDRGMANLPRLAEILNVDSSFETAVEVVLGNYLEAVCIDDIENIASDISGLDAGNLTFFLNNTSSAVIDSESSVNHLQKLSSKINTSLPVMDLLKGVYVVDDIKDALNSYKSLNDADSIITKCGFWISKNWVKSKSSKEFDAKSGVLAREKELKTISADLEKNQQTLENLDLKQSEVIEDISKLELELAGARKEQQAISVDLRELTAKLSSHKTKLETTRARNERITSEIEEYHIRLEDLNETVNISRATLEESIEKMAVFSEQKEDLLSQKDSISLGFEEVELKSKQKTASLHEIELRRQTVLTQTQSIKDNLSRADVSLSSMLERQSELQTMLDSSSSEEEIKQELETLLAERIEIESKLTKAREELDLISQKVEDDEKERTEIENTVQAMRNDLDKVKMEWQSLEVRKGTIQEKFDKESIDVNQIIKELPEEANELDWEQMLEELNKKIERLGPINLAAIEEYKSESERAEYLKAQQADLSEALETLENAIRKIDKETRAKFKETFDEVNSNFKAIFPKLFGGGEAYLDLTGDDLLETGVSVMARPPGKRNSSIQLLSGGEKALTAVSLVFAIFQLNPAPFCMLDEVDAPLDDANVGRFCKMIVEMSEKVQFIFITHNKITMETSKQLAGVTMKEPGVSRLVAVDVDQAVQMIEA